MTLTSLLQQEEEYEDKDDVYGLNASTSNESRTKMNTLDREIEEYFDEASLHEDSDVLTYWDRRKKQYPFLYKITSLLFQIPIAEVNCERLFSNLKFILNYLRTSLGPETLNDLLLIRSNFHILDRSFLMSVINRYC